MSYTFLAQQTMPKETRVLIVSGFDHNCSTTRLELFFKNNSKSGGGPIHCAQMNEMNSKFAVQFQDEKSKNQICIAQYCFIICTVIKAKN